MICVRLHISIPLNDYVIYDKFRATDCPSMSKRECMHISDTVCRYLSDSSGRLLRSNLVRGCPKSRGT